MSSLNLNIDNGFSLDLKVSPSSHVPSSSNTSLMGHANETESEKTEIPFEILNPLVINPKEKMITNKQGDEGYFGNEKNNLPLNVGEEENEAKNSSLAIEKIGNTKLSIRGHWRPNEDAKLIEVIGKLGPQNWNNIAQHLHGRSGKSCRLRWCNQLDPKLNRGVFSEEEEEKLLAAHKIYGNKWALICKLFPGRTDNAVKNHWHVLMARRLRNQSSTSSKMKKSTFQISSNILMNMNLTNYNVPSESTISSTIDESNSTCTNLNLITMPNFHNNHALPNFQTYGSQIGLLGERNVAARDNGFDKFFSASTKGSCDCHMGKLKIMDKSNYSDSISEVSISQSVATNKTNVSILGESENVKDKIKRSFIDFLGVGETL